MSTTLTAISFDAPPAGGKAKPGAKTAGAKAAAAKPGARAGARAGGRQRLSRAELIQLGTQLGVMLDTGVTIVDALRCVAGQADRPNVKFVVEDVAAAVERGDEFSAALTRHPKSFPRIFVALVKASERGGGLAKMIDRANGYLKDEAEILRKVKGALTYPGIMFAFACVTCVSMLTFVLPRFTALYKGKEELLPTPTKVLLAISGALTGHWQLLLPATILSAGGAVWWLRSPAGQRAWHRAQLRLPLLGPMFRKLHLARGLRMIGTLASGGVSLVDCLETARDLAGNGRYAALWSGSEAKIRSGVPFSESLRGQGLVPSSVTQMLHSGEAGGRLAQVTERVAEHAEIELKETIADLTRYIEPAMIVLMGALIGGMTMAMLLPVFTVSRVMTAH